MCRVVLQSLEEFIYLLVDHGYDDLASMSECTAAELAELVHLFTTADSKKSITQLVEALRELGITVYRKQKSEFRRLIELDERNKKQSEISEQVSRVRGESMAIKPPSDAPTPAASAAAADPAAAASTAASSAASSSSSSVAAASPMSKSGPLKLPPPLAAGAAADASAAATAANPTHQWDVTLWDGAIHFQAYIHSVCAYARAFDEQCLPADLLETKLLEGRTYVQLQKIQRQLSALVDGAIFKKFKRGSAARRMIWTSSALDFLLWGDENKLEVSGGPHPALCIARELGGVELTPVCFALLLCSLPLAVR